MKLEIALRDLILAWVQLSEPVKPRKTGDGAAGTRPGFRPPVAAAVLDWRESVKTWVRGAYPRALFTLDLPFTAIPDAEKLRFLAVHARVIADSAPDLAQELVFAAVNLTERGNQIAGQPDPPVKTLTPCTCGVNLYKYRGRLICPNPLCADNKPPASA